MVPSFDARQCTQLAEEPLGRAVRGVELVRKQARVFVASVCWEAQRRMGICAICRRVGTLILTFCNTSEAAVVLVLDVATLQSGRESGWLAGASISQGEMSTKRTRCRSQSAGPGKSPLRFYYSPPNSTLAQI